MIIILNNKNKLLITDYNKYISELENIDTNNKLVLCPSDIYLSLKIPHKYHLGSQNVSFNNELSNTGEINAEQLKSIGVEYTIVGHSERRIYQKETNKEVRKKIKNLLKADIIPILCIGETKSEHENNETLKVITEELNECLKGIENDNIIIAYEPIWAIGTGLTPSIEQIQKVVNYIKQINPNNPIVYGGSITEENIKKIKDVQSLDGYLLGGLSLYPNKLVSFLNNLKDN